MPNHVFYGMGYIVNGNDEFGESVNIVERSINLNIVTQIFMFVIRNRSAAAGVNNQRSDKSIYRRKI